MEHGEREGELTLYFVPVRSSSRSSPIGLPESSSSSLSSSKADAGIALKDLNEFESLSVSGRSYPASTAAKRAWYLGDCVFEG